MAPTMPAVSIVFAAAAVLYGIAAWTDLTRRIIPNMVSVLIAILGCVCTVLLGAPGGLVTVATALVVFMLLAFLCMAGMIGGGDVKLIASTVLLVGAANTLDFIAATAIVGGVLSLLYLATGRLLRRLAKTPRSGGSHRERSDPFRLHLLWRAECRRIRRGGPLPYGIAIATGALVTLGFQVL